MNKNIESLILLLLIVACGCQIKKSEEAPWANLSWIEKSSINVVVSNLSNENTPIEIAYYNNSTREAYVNKLDIKKGISDTISFKVFRPELIKIRYNGNEFDMFIIPYKDMEIVLEEELIFEGPNKVMYENLLHVGDHVMKKDSFENLIATKKLPIWLNDYLIQSRALKTVYATYHNANYRQYIGEEGIEVSKKDSIQSIKLLENYKTGQCHTYYNLLQVFKYNFELMKKNKAIPVELEGFMKRKNLFDIVMSIEDEKIRNNMLAIHIESSLIRKRKSFNSKDELLTHVINLLPEKHVLALNEIEKEYTDQNYDLSNVIHLLKENIASINGEEKPLTDSSKKYKLLKFWFAGCAPCKKQIPYENKLLKEFDDLQINHFCYNTDIEKWKEYILKNEPAGNHHYLDKENYKEFKKVFKLGYAPRYILLDANHEVICWECSNPSNKELEIKLRKG